MSMSTLNRLVNSKKHSEDPYSVGQGSARGIFAIQHVEARPELATPLEGVFALSQFVLRAMLVDAGQRVVDS